MSRTLPAALLMAALGSAACASTGSTGTTASGPVSVPPSTTPGAVGTSGAADSAPTQVNSDARGQIPVGHELDVRLQAPLSSATAKVEQRFEATTVADIMQDGRVLVPAGSVVRGVVSSVDPAGRGLDRAGRMTLSFDQITVNGRTYDLRAQATSVFESGGIREEAGTAGAGAGIGGVVGGIIGGVKGAVLGAIIGAGGAIAATDGKDVELPAGSIVRIRLDSPVTVR
ncbi:MAG: hypothetical protein AB7P99_09055 [Vicinamibacterales bacterium]